MSRPEAEKALSLAFAQAIVRPGGSALVIDEANRSGADPGRRWISVEEAVASGQTFAVEPHEHVAVVDIDDEADRAWGTAVRAGLAARGCQFVLATSGRPEHFHLWVLMPPGWNYEYLKTQMEEVAGAPRSWAQVRRNATRPPYAPHRLGGRAKLVEPGLRTALKLFRSHRSQGVPPLARDALMWLRPEAVIRSHGRVARGQTIYRAALSLVNARCTQQDLRTLLESGWNEVTSKYLDLPSDRRSDYLDRVWTDACKYVRANPPKATHRETLKALREDIPNMAWRPRTGANDRKVYAALLTLGIGAATLVVNASVRQLAMSTTISPGGVRSAVRRLAEQGLIARSDESGRPHHLASSFRLLTDVPRESDVLAHTLPSYGGPMTRCVEEPQVLEVIAEIFTRLGQSTRETWEVLPEQPPIKTAEVVALRPGEYAHATVREHLKKLHRHKFAGRTGNRWWRLEPSHEELVDLAVGLGVFGRNARVNARLGREQNAYQKSSQARPGYGSAA